MDLLSVALARPRGQPPDELCALIRDPSPDARATAPAMRCRGVGGVLDALYGSDALPRPLVSDVDLWGTVQQRVVLETHDD